MAGHRLGGADQGFVGVIAQRQFHGIGFGQITQGRGGAVCVEVIDLVGIDTGILHRHHHAARRAFAGIARCRHVIGIGTGAETGQFAINAGTAGFGVFVFLQHQNAGAVAEHETVAVAVPRTAGACGFVIAGRQRLHRAESGNGGRCTAVLGATGHHDISIAVLDHAHGHADGMVGGRTGRNGREVRTLEAFHDAQLAGNHIDDGAWHVKRRDLARTAQVQIDRGLFDAADAADAGPDQHTGALGIGLGDFQTGILHGHE